MKYSWLLFFIVGTAYAVQTSKNNSERVIGGDSARIGQFPWNAALKYNGYFICSGALIGVNFIVTSAECLKPYNAHPELITATLGSLSSQPNPGVTEYKGLLITLHPSYSRANDKLNSNADDDIMHHNNIAILRLATSVVLSDSIQPIVMMKTGDVPHASDVELCGWGHQKGNVTPQLEYAQLVTMDVDTCITLAGGNPAIDHNFNVCTAAYNPITGQKAGGCTMDHGAPLIQLAPPTYSPVLVGIVSFANCEDTKVVTPTIYSKISGHFPWISSITGIM